MRLFGNRRNPEHNPDNPEGRDEDDHEERHQDGSGNQLHGLVRTGLSWSLVNSTAGRAISMLSGIVIARFFLSPSQFGEFAIALVAINLLLGINDVGMAATMVRWPGDVDRVGPTATTLIFGVSLVAYVVFFAVAPSIASVLHVPQATGVLRIIGLAVVIDGAFAVPTAMLTRSFRQDQRAIADLTGIVLSTCLAILLGYKGYGAASLAWGRLLGNTANALLIVRFSPKRYRPGFDRAAARDLLGYSVPLAGSTLLAVAVLNVPYAITARALTPFLLGLYLIAFNISSWPVNFLSITIQRVSIAGFARLQHDRTGLHAAFTRSMALLAAVTVPGCVLMSALAYDLILVIYGHKWTAAWSALQFLALFAIVRIAQNLAYDALVAVGKAQATVWLQGGWLAALIPASALGARLGGIEGVAVAQLAVGVLVVIPVYLWALHRMGVKILDLGRHLTWPAVGGVMAGFGAVLGSHLVAGALTQLVVGGVIGLVLFVIAVLPMRRMLRPREPAAMPA